MKKKAGIKKNSDRKLKNTQHVKEKLEEAIRMGYENKDPQVQAEWERIFGKDQKPNVEEFIKNIADFLK